MIIEYSRVRPDAKPPQRANPSDAGLDLFYNPPAPEANIRIEPGQSVVLETGLAQSQEPLTALAQCEC